MKKINDAFVIKHKDMIIEALNSNCKFKRGSPKRKVIDLCRSECGISSKYSSWWMWTSLKNTMRKNGLIDIL